MPFRAIDVPGGAWMVTAPLMFRSSSLQRLWIRSPDAYATVANKTVRAQAKQKYFPTSIPPFGFKVTKF